MNVTLVFQDQQTPGKDILIAYPDEAWLPRVHDTVITANHSGVVLDVRHSLSELGHVEVLVYILLDPKK